MRAPLPFPYGFRERAGDAGGRPHQRPPLRRLQRAAPRPRPRHLIPGRPNLAVSAAPVVRFLDSVHSLERAYPLALLGDALIWLCEPIVSKLPEL